MIIGPYYSTDSGWVRFRQQGNHMVAETAKSPESAWETSHKEYWDVEDSESKKSFRFLLKEGKLFRIHHGEEEGVSNTFRALIDGQHLEWQPMDAFALDATNSHIGDYFALNDLDDEQVSLILTNMSLTELQKIGKLNKRLFHLANEQIIPKITGIGVPQFTGYDEKIGKDSDATQLFWKHNFERHFPYYKVNGNVNWQIEFEQTATRDYQQLSPKMRRLFSLAKEGDAHSISELIPTLTPEEIIQTDANGFALAYWLVRQGLQDQADFFYQQVKTYQYQSKLGEENLRVPQWAVICNQDPSLYGAFTPSRTSVDEGSLSQLELAVKYGNQKWVEDLITRGAKSKIIFDLAVEFGHYEVFKYLFNHLEVKGKVYKDKTISHFKESILPLAAEKGRTAVVHLLLEKYPYMLREPEQIKVLFKKAVLGGNEHLIELFGNLLLPFEFENDSLEVLNILREQPDYNIHATLANGLTPIQLAVDSGAYKVVKQLVDLGVDLHQKDSRGNSLLHLAALSENDNKKEKIAKIADFLIENGLEVDAVNDEGKTPLYITFTGLRSSLKRPTFFRLLLCGGKLDREIIKAKPLPEGPEAEYPINQVTDYLFKFRSFLGRIFNDKIPMDFSIGGQNAAVRKIFNENPEMPRGEAIFTILLSDKVDPSLLSKLAKKKGKEEVVSFLRALPAQEELAYINSILDEQNDHALKSFFHVQRGLLKPSIERGQLFVLKQRQKELTTSTSERVEDRIKPKPLHKIDKAYVNVMSISPPTREDNIRKVLQLLDSDLMKNQEGFTPHIIREIREKIERIDPKETLTVVSILNEIRGVIASMDEKGDEKNDIVISVLDVFAKKKTALFK
ncbi:Ankyrin repeats (3 copies) [Legionella wadsworthii]|uniref:Ankyrin repeats (3 copies) n=1 Tax=Legionella wadsworthii TaxID=28088 RepID=A0A378LW45_9GAMM|nr:ankyrin repeat domain-containing protein [Legionella wadsworthii]STY28281.1 Ankyrin repeats (3 copies) [Legionella wadsworthii]